MKNHFAPVLLALSLTIATAGAQTILTFDDISAGSVNVPMPAGYGGVDWASNMGIYGTAQSPYDPESSPNRVLFNLNNESGVAESLVTFVGGPQVFDGAYFSGLENIQFNLYNAGILVAQSTILNLGSGTGPTFLASGYAGPVNQVGIVGDEGFFVMDNFTFQSVPEPSAFCLFGLGALALALRSRQRVNR